MGMSSSQARLLTLTARMHDIEFRAQRIQADKLRLANESDKVYNTYLEALDATKVQYKSIANDGSIMWNDATLAALENGYVAGYSGPTSPDTYFLQDLKSGAIYISKDYAASIGVTSDSDIYTGTLLQWLEEKGAPKKDEEYITGYTPGYDETTVSSIKTVDNTGFVEYSPSYFTYTPALNATEAIPDELISGKTYTISSADDLAHLARISRSARPNTTNVTIELADDIDMSTLSSGLVYQGISNFAGTFNGNGHTISNLTDCLFTSISGARIDNLKLDHSTITSNADDIGALIGSCYNTSVSNIKCYSATINGTGTRRGGLIGSATGVTDSSKSKIKNCSFNGTVNPLPSCIVFHATCL